MNPVSGACIVARLKAEWTKVSTNRSSRISSSFQTPRTRSFFLLFFNFPLLILSITTFQLPNFYVLFLCITVNLIMVDYSILCFVEFSVFKKFFSKILSCAKLSKQIMLILGTPFDKTNFLPENIDH